MANCLSTRSGVGQSSFVTAFFSGPRSDKRGELRSSFLLTTRVLEIMERWIRES